MDNGDEIDVMVEQTGGASFAWNFLFVTLLEINLPSLSLKCNLMSQTKDLYSN